MPKKNLTNIYLYTYKIKRNEKKNTSFYVIYIPKQVYESTVIPWQLKYCWDYSAPVPTDLERHSCRENITLQLLLSMEYVHRAEFASSLWCLTLRVVSTLCDILNLHYDPQWNWGDFQDQAVAPEVHWC